MISPNPFFVSFEAYIRRHKLTRELASIALSALDSVFSIPVYLARVRFLRITAPGRIGHLAIEPDIFIKERLLGQRPYYFGILISPPGIAANECLLDYWSRYITIVRSPFWARIMNRLYRHPYLQYDASRYSLAINETAPFIAVQKQWGKRSPLLSLTETHRRNGRAALAEMGVPADAKFVCFHCREAGYSPSDEALHSFRNCRIENYLPAIAALTAQGYWCIRMGDPTMRPVQPMANMIDYAHHSARSDWMDVFLCASCSFFLGSSSGLLFVASIFGRPSGSANHAPMSTVLAFNAGDVAIPKLLWSETERRYLSFPEVFESEAGNFRFTPLYWKNGIALVDNAAEDIRDLAQEMLERLEGRAVYSPDDEALQTRFRALMRPGHYSFGGENRVGRDFLRKYREYLGHRDLLHHGLDPTAVR
ncbi:MAG: TIGR04372 family glycosyltransferase [Betaproteobacteria bacterium]